MISSKPSRITALFIAIFYAASTAAYADTLTGKIISIRSLESGQSEIVLGKGQKKETLVLNSETEVESVTSAEKLKAGAMIFLSPQTGAGGSRSSGRRGLKSPFRGIPKNMQKSMGLPNMPEVPSVPGQPEEIKNLPKVPKIPKVAKKKGKEAPAEAEPEANVKQGRPPVQHPTVEPTEEEKTLYGKVSSDKPLLRSSGEPAGPEKMTAKKVLSVKAVKGGVLVELQGPDGKKQQMTLPAKSAVTQAFSSGGLRKNMQVTAEAFRADKVKIAQKITVVS